jgi:hypothetical protein
VVNPHHVAALQSDSITTPNVLRVQFGDVDVLQDDVASTHNAQALTLDDTR